MNDPTFGPIEYHGDAWDGVVPFEFHPAGTTQFGVHIWADPSGPSDTQRATFRELLAHYPRLWPSIAQSMLDSDALLGSITKIEQGLYPSVGCYIDREATQGHSDFDLVYSFTFELEAGSFRGFFVRIVGWQVVEAVIAD